MDNRADARRMAQRFADALTTGDLSLFDALVAEDYVNHNPYVAPGREGVTSFFAGWRASFPDTRVTVEDALLSDDGGTVVGRFTYRATHTGTPFLGIPTTNRPIVMRSIDIWRVGEHGLFTEHWDELNLLEVFQQLGSFPPQGES
jgi:steroid delta-isomerase-like uncharacterized protein